MGAQGTATLDFGAFPGASDTSVTVTGQTGIVSGSLVEAWIRLTASADHSADEHLLETIRVAAGNIVAGTGFTIYGINTNPVHEPVDAVTQQLGRFSGAGQNPGPGQQDTQPGRSMGGTGTRLYGQWSVAWVWN